jgi:hypothetical protein
MTAPADTATVSIPSDLLSTGGLDSLDPLLTRPAFRTPRLLLLDVSALPALAVVEALHRATGIAESKTEAMRRSMGRVGAGRRLATTQHETMVKDKAGKRIRFPRTRLYQRGEKGTRKHGRGTGRGGRGNGRVGLAAKVGSTAMVELLGGKSCFFNFVRVVPNVPYVC